MIQMLRMLLALFAFRISLKLGGLKTIAVAIGALAENAKNQNGLKNASKIQFSPNLSREQVVKEIAPRMIDAPNLTFFKIREDMDLEELKIRAQIFDWNDLPPIKGKLYFFRTPYYWFEA